MVNDLQCTGKQLSWIGCWVVENVDKFIPMFKYIRRNFVVRFTKGSTICMQRHTCEPRDTALGRLPPFSSSYWGESWGSCWNALMQTTCGRSHILRFTVCPIFSLTKIQPVVFHLKATHFAFLIMARKHGFLTKGLVSFLIPDKSIPFGKPHGAAVRGNVLPHPSCYTCYFYLARDGDIQNVVMLQNSIAKFPTPDNAMIVLFTGNEVC